MTIEEMLGNPAPIHDEPTLDAALAVKYERLQAILCEMESVLVAYSGGVDSALLLKVATDMLGERAIGALASSPAYDDDETAEAASVATQLGARLERIETHEMDDPRYAANTAERCYFCKVELFDQLEPVAARLGLANIAYGMNRDDRGDWRPGQRAARERGVRAPLDEADMGKDDIRMLARHLGVPVWEKPAEACYSSRIPYGMPVTMEALRKIGRAERALRGLGFRGVRVRHHESVARIEIDPQDFACLLDPAYASRQSRACAPPATPTSHSISRATAPARSTRRCYAATNRAADTGIALHFDRRQHLDDRRCYNWMVGGNRDLMLTRPHLEHRMNQCTWPP